MGVVRLPARANIHEEKYKSLIAQECLTADAPTVHPHSADAQYDRTCSSVGSFSTTQVLD